VDLAVILGGTPSPKAIKYDGYPTPGKIINAQELLTRGLQYVNIIFKRNRRLWKRGAIFFKTGS